MGVIPVISHGGGGFATAVGTAPLVTETVVISGSASPSPIALSVPMNGQYDAPPTETEVAITNAMGIPSGGHANGNGGATANGNGGATANGNGGATASGGTTLKRKQWMWLGALGLGMLLLARK